MDFGTVFIVVIVLSVLCGVAQAMEKIAKTKTDAEQRKAGEHKIVCPQCQERGFVTTASVTEKTGIHGGKATAAILTGGVSMLATGLSNELGKTQATCSNCGSTWRF
jgi:hypothetical protein